MEVAFGSTACDRESILLLRRCKTVDSISSRRDRVVGCDSGCYALDTSPSRGNHARITRGVYQMFLHKVNSPPSGGCGHLCPGLGSCRAFDGEAPAGCVCCALCRSVWGILDLCRTLMSHVKRLLFLLHDGRRLLFLLGNGRMLLRLSGDGRILLFLLGNGRMLLHLLHDGSRLLILLHDGRRLLSVLRLSLPLLKWSIPIPC